MSDWNEEEEDIRPPDASQYTRLIDDARPRPVATAATAAVSEEDEVAIAMALSMENSTAEYDAAMLASMTTLEEESAKRAASNAVYAGIAAKLTRLLTFVSEDKREERELYEYVLTMMTIVQEGIMEHVHCEHKEHTMAMLLQKVRLSSEEIDALNRLMSA